MKVLNAVLLLGALLLTACTPAALRTQPNARLNVSAQLSTPALQTITGERVYREPGPQALLVRTDRPAFVTTLLQVSGGPIQVLPVGAVPGNEVVGVGLPAALGEAQVFTVASLEPMNLSAARGLGSLSDAAKVVEAQARTLAPGAYTVTKTSYRVARFGTLEVTSNVPGAAVRLNGRLVGRTPMSLADVPEGSVEVSVLHPSFTEFTRQVNVTADTVTTVRASLRRAVGTLVVLSTTPASVLVGGQIMGSTPLRVPVRAGAVAVTVLPSNPAIGPASFTAEVLPGENTTVQCTVVNNALSCSD